MVVGEARVIVRAITTGVRRDIQRGFDGVDDIGRDAGRNISRGLSRGFAGGGGGGGMFANLASAAEGARAQFDSLIRTAYTLGPVIGQLAGAIGALVGGFSALALTVAGALPSLLALPGALVSIATAATTLKLAFSGVGDAISAGVKASGGGGGGARAAARDLTNLYRRIEDARERLRRVYEESARAIEDAEERLADAVADYNQQQIDSARDVEEARREYSETVRDGLEDIADAQERLQEVENRAASDIARAKQRVERAQLELNAAFEAGREEIQQLNFAAEDAVIAEKRAALELEKAREQLLRVQDLPPNDRARREAELAFAQADLNYRKAMDTNADMAKEQERVNQEGIEGTAAVSRARDNLASAEQARADAEARALSDIADARLQLARTERDAAEAKIKAEEDIALAVEQAAQREADAKDKISDAEENLQEVIIKRLDAEYDAQLALERAEEDLKKARKESNAAGAGGANAYQNALKKLSKEQRQFVKYMVDTFIPAIDDLRDAAAKEFFPQLIPAMENLRTRLFPALIPLLEKTGGVLGKIAKDFTDNLTSDESIRQIEKIWDASDNTLAGLGEVASNALSGVLNVLEASLPLVQRFVDWLVDLSEDFKGLLDTEGERNAFTTFLEKSGDVSAALGDIFGNVFGGLGNLISEQVEPGSGGWMMLDFFKEAAANFKEFTEVNVDRINEFFKNTAGNSQSILSFIGAFVKEILKLGENPNVGVFFDKLKDLAPIVGDIGNKMIDAGPALADFLKSFLEFADATLDSGAIQTFWEVLTGIFSALTTVFKNPVMQEALKIVGGLAAAGVALRTAWMLLRIPILGILEPVTKVMKLLMRFGPIARIVNIVALNMKAFVALFGATGVGAVVLVIAGVVAAFVAMWRESEIFREAIKKLIDTVLNKLVEIFNDLKQRLDEALEPLGGMEGLVDKLKTAFKFLGDILGTYVIPFLEGGLVIALDVIGEILGTIIDLVGGFIETFSNIATKLGEGDIGGAVKELLYGIFIKPFDTIFSNLLGLWDTTLETIKTYVSQVFGGTFIEDIVNGLINGLQGLLQAVQDIWNNIVNWVKEFLGIASPSTVFQDIGQAIVDGIAAALEFLLDVFFLPFELAVEKVEDFLDNTFIPFITGLPDKVATALTGLFSEIFDLFSDAWDSLKAFINGTFIPFITGLPEKISTVLSSIWEPLGTLFDTAVSGVKTAWDTFIGTVRTFVTRMKTALSTLWSPITSGLTTAWNRAKTWWNNNVAGKGFSFGGSYGIPKVELKIPRLALGGVVPATRGGMLALVGEGGRDERVEPLDSMGLSRRDREIINMLSGGQKSGNPVTINVYASPGMDEIEIANVVSREISFMMRKGSV